MNSSRARFLDIFLPQITQDAILCILKHSQLQYQLDPILTGIN